MSLYCRWPRESRVIYPGLLSEVARLPAWPAPARSLDEPTHRGVDAAPPWGSRENRRRRPSSPPYATSPPLAEAPWGERWGGGPRSGRSRARHHPPQRWLSHKLSVFLTLQPP